MGWGISSNGSGPRGDNADSARLLHSIASYRSPTITPLHILPIWPADSDDVAIHLTFDPIAVIAGMTNHAIT